MSEHCGEALEQLYAYLDQELDQESVTLIRTHIGECPPCCDAFAFEERLLVAVRTGLREEVPSAVIERIRVAIRTEFR
ncbi:MAG TPA: zf-HC2 domain-containing protein [Acidimicrobiia bacterium]|nr:zf-HC2 domain-containing protein [Acidimicrobiia bacterium]